MIKSPDYTKHVGDKSRHMAHHAQRAWNKRSKEEQNGIFAGLVTLLVMGLVTMIWRAGRNSSSGYVEVPSHDDDWF